MSAVPKLVRNRGQRHILDEQLVVAPDEMIHLPEGSCSEGYVQSILQRPGELARGTVHAVAESAKRECYCAKYRAAQTRALTLGGRAQVDFAVDLEAHGQGRAPPGDVLLKNVWEYTVRKRPSTASLKK